MKYMFTPAIKIVVKPYVQKQLWLCHTSQCLRCIRTSCSTCILKLYSRKSLVFLTLNKNNLLKTIAPQTTVWAWSWWFQSCSTTWKSMHQISAFSWLTTLRTKRLTFPYFNSKTTSIISALSLKTMTSITCFWRSNHSFWSRYSFAYCTKERLYSLTMNTPWMQPLCKPSLLCYIHWVGSVLWLAFCHLLW